VTPRGQAAAPTGDLGAPGSAARALRMVVTLPIVAYQRLVSPLLVPRCRYYPSCSQYAVEAIRRFGILRGLVLAAWRLLRCNPWSHGGYDPVEAQRVFRTGPERSD
jgi:putative membrane protein insertion efficiency factor